MLEAPCYISGFFCSGVFPPPLPTPIWSDGIGYRRYRAANDVAAVRNDLRFFSTATKLLIVVSAIPQRRRSKNRWPSIASSILRSIRTAARAKVGSGHGVV